MSRPSTAPIGSVGLNSSAAGAATWARACTGVSSSTGLATPVRRSSADASRWARASGSRVTAARDDPRPWRLAALMPVDGRKPTTLPAIVTSRAKRYPSPDGWSSGLPYLEQCRWPGGHEHSSRRDTTALSGRTSSQPERSLRSRRSRWVRVRPSGGRGRRRARSGFLRSAGSGVHPFRPGTSPARWDGRELPGPSR